jgi:hypothetical protein
MYVGGYNILDHVILSANMNVQRLNIICIVVVVVGGGVVVVVVEFFLLLLQCKCCGVKVKDNADKIGKVKADMAKSKWKGKKPTEEIPVSCCKDITQVEGSAPVATDPTCTTNPTVENAYIEKVSIVMDIYPGSHTAGQDCRC